MPLLSTFLRFRTCAVSRRSSLGSLARQRSTRKLSISRLSSDRRANTCSDTTCSGLTWPLILPAQALLQVLRLLTSSLLCRISMRSSLCLLLWTCHSLKKAMAWGQREAGRLRLKQLTTCWCSLGRLGRPPKVSILISWSFIGTWRTGQRRRSRWQISWSTNPIPARLYLPIFQAPNLRSKCWPKSQLGQSPSTLRPIRNPTCSLLHPSPPLRWWFISSSLVLVLTSISRPKQASMRKW